MIKKIPKTLPCLDLQAGIRQLEGNRQVYLKVLKKFAECNLDLVCNIQECLNKNDRKRARLLVHSTKGVAGSIGATDLYSVSAALESAIMQGEYQKTLQDFAGTLQTVLQSITALLDDQEDNDIPILLGEETEIAVLLPMLEELDHYLREGNFRALESYTALQRYVAGTSLEDEVNSLELHIQRFDYKKVAERLALIYLRLRNQQW